MISASANFLSANAVLRKEPIFLFTIAGYSRVFTNKATGISGQVDWIVDVQDLSCSVSDMDGGADLGQLIVTVQDPKDLGNPITADFPSFVFEGKAVTLSTGFVGMSQTDFVTLFTGVIDSVESSNQNTSYDFTCTDNTLRLSQVIYTRADNGRNTDSNNRRTLNGHPLDILLAIFSTELALPTSAYNQTKIQGYRDGLFAGTQFNFSIDSPPAAKDFIEKEIMRPLGGYLWTNGQGELDVVFFYPANTGLPPAMLLDIDNTLGPPDHDIPVAIQSDLINTMSFRFDKPDSSSDSGGSSSGYSSELVDDYTFSISKYGQYGQQIIESEGMRSGLQGFINSIETAQQIFLRYGLKQLKFDQVYDCDWTACVLEPGDLVAVTNPFIPDRSAGVMGTNAKRFEVLDRTLSFEKGTVTLSLIEANLMSTWEIAPNGTGTFSSGTPYLYFCDDSDQYSGGVTARNLG